MDNVKESIGEWLQDYGVDQFDGAAAFTWRESIDFALQLTTDQSHLLLHSVVGMARESDDAELFRKLLRLNYLGIETQGATLALDETGVNIVLWISLPTADLGPARFDQVIGSFLDLSERIAGTILVPPSASG